jgi:hypothetical protein
MSAVNTRTEKNMKRYLWSVLIIAFLTAVPALMAQDQDRFEVGAFGEVFRYTNAPPPQNFVGLGGRVGIGMSPHASIEAEMAYDFKKNYTSTFTNGVTSSLGTTNFRTIHAFFGPDFHGDFGPVQLFATGKVGFDNFSVSNQNAPAGFKNSVGLTNGTTAFAVYPAAGVAFFAHWFGIRLEAGDDIYFLNGNAHNNLRATFGPQFRF